jgi:adenylate cyclase
MLRVWKFCRQHGLRFLISILIVFVFLVHTLEIRRWEFLEYLERRAYDVRLNLNLPSFDNKESKVAIVDIDEKSLKALGRFPWKRSILATLLDELFDYYKVNLVGFDIVFPEPDQSSGLNILEKLADKQLKDQPAFLEKLDQLRSELNYDQRFANSLKDRRVVLGFTMISNKECERGGCTSSGELPKPILNLSDLQGISQPMQAEAFASNLPLFSQIATAGGHFSQVPDLDSIVRRTPMLYSYNNQLYPSLPLAMAQVFLGEPFIEPVIIKNGNYQAIDTLKLGNHFIPVNKKLESLIPYRGKSRSFLYSSVVDVLEHKVALSNLENKAIIIGTTAQGLFDLRAAPVEEIYPGVEIHANMLSGLLEGYLLASPAFVHGAEVFLMLISVIIMIILVFWVNPLWSVISAIMISIGIVWTNLWFWKEYQLVIPLASTLVMIWTLFLFNMGLGYFLETRHKRQLANLFGQYVPPQLVDEMSKNPRTTFSLEGDSREMTVLFSDVRGFTSISEGLSPQELSQLMNIFLTPMTYLIHHHRGTIDKYMGDAIMAFWGAPLHDPQHAKNALLAALDMIKKLHELQPIFKSKGWPEIHIGVGLNTGVMNVGNMGSEFRMAYTVLGDAVNLGSRLEGLTKQYGVSIIVSETVKIQVKDHAFRELDRVRVKGKDKPVAIFEPLGEYATQDSASRQELELYHQALHLYRQQQWDEAESILNTLLTRNSNKLIYKIYLERVMYFRSHPPEINWDGVTTFTTK